MKAEPSFEFYRAPIFKGYDFEEDDFLIVPETLLVLSREFKRIASQRTFIWWLSVDNSPLPWANNYETRMNKVNSEWFGVTKPGKTWLNDLYEQLFEIKYSLLASSPSSKLHRINPKKVNNLCQSTYAMSLLRQRGMKNLRYLSDYVEVEGGVDHDFALHETGRTRIAYNFAKSKDQVEVLKSIDESIDFIPLTRLSARDMAEELKRAHLFLDLGHFPGKDRLPREAILLGCPVLLAKRGAARHERDFPLDEDFLIDLEHENPMIALSKIYKIACDKEAAFAQQQRFLTDVINQKETFSEEVKHLKYNLEMIDRGSL